MSTDRIIPAHSPVVQLLTKTTVRSWSDPGHTGLLQETTRRRVGRLRMQASGFEAKGFLLEGRLLPREKLC